MDEHDITKAVIDELTRECSALTAERDTALARAEAAEQERDALRLALSEILSEMPDRVSLPLVVRIREIARAALKDADWKYAASNINECGHLARLTVNGVCVECERDALSKLLSRLEWEGNESETLCPLCRCSQRDGHHETCELSAALKDAD